MYLKIFSYIKLLFELFKEIYAKKYIIYELAKRDFKLKYKGSYLGFFWTLLQPALFVLIIWFVLTVGFNFQKIENTSQTYWLIAGIIPWLFFSEVFVSVTTVIRQYWFLIKRPDFSLGILPIVKILSELIVHSVFLIIAIIVGFFFNTYSGFFLVQIFYYIFGMSFLLIGLGWLSSSTSMFVRDVNNIVSILVQFGFWVTPVFWSISMVPTRYQWIIKLNPLYYIVTGYRDTLIFKIPFWEHINETIYFWGFVVATLVIGAVIFRRLRPHFAEVI